MAAGRFAGILAGLVIGVGAGLAAPVLMPGLVQSGRPWMKRLIKSGLLAYERGRLAAAEAGEMAEDVIAEAKAELESENAGSAVAQRSASVAGAKQVIS